MAPAVLAALIQGGSSLIGSGMMGIGSGMAKNEELDFMREKDRKDREERERELQMQRGGMQRADYWKSIDSLAGNAAAGADKARMYSFANKVFG